jgi:acetolactate synthase-1/3 small subunit
MAPNPQLRPDQHTITVLVENKPGVLSRCVGLFARRGYNIESLAVSITDDPTLSRMTVVTSGDERSLDQIGKQLEKLVDVAYVVDYTAVPSLHRELALIKVRAEDVNRRAEIKQFAEVFRASIVDVSERAFVLEVTGDTDKIDALERLLEPYGILEMVRTGAIVIGRGSSTAYGPDGTGAAQSANGTGTPHAALQAEPSRA